MRRHTKIATPLFRLNIKDEESVKQGFANITRRILQDHPLDPWMTSCDIKGSLDGIVDAAKAWLNRPHSTRWLMIFDSYDNPPLSGISSPKTVAL